MVDIETVIKIAVNGSKEILELTKKIVKEAVEENGANKKIAYPETAYELPIIFALFDKRIQTLADVLEIVEGLNVDDAITVENALTSGVTVVICCEVIEALKYLKEQPYKEPCRGFVPDAVIREMGVPLVDGTIVGVAVVVGKTGDKEKSVKIVRELQDKGLLSLLIGDIINEVKEDIRFGAGKRVVPLGEDATSVAHAFNLAFRAGLMFGGIKRGEKEKIMDYVRKKISAFVLALGELSDAVVAAGFGAVNFGMPVITNQNVPEIKGSLVVEQDLGKIASKALEVRNIKVEIVDIPIPISYGFAYLGERIRKADCYFEAGGAKTKTFFLVKTVEAEKINDHDIEVIGKDIGDMEEGSLIPLGIFVEVAGKKMQKDFEPVIEGRSEDFINAGEGLWQTGKRTLMWMRVSKDAVKKGFMLRHLGEILYAKIKNEFKEVVDKVKVSIISDEEKLLSLLEEVKKVYEERDKRMKGLTDESVDTFYTCLLCQSFAPNHVCIVTPERLGLCGAVSWLDAKAGYQLKPSGGNQPIKIGEAKDKEKGSWSEIDAKVKEDSHGKLEHVNVYSLMENPHTSCGCFECIVALVPEANGVMIVNREYNGDTPCGMRFSTLAGNIGGGIQTPGL
jgi:acetyl-CoA synthase